MYQPKNMPEVTIFYDYAPAEYERGYQATPADVEIIYLEINGDIIGDTLENHLIETFGDQWCQEIIGGLERRAA
jgi:hypothetical protein